MITIPITGPIVGEKPPEAQDLVAPSAPNESTDFTPPGAGNIDPVADINAGLPQTDAPPDLLTPAFNGESIAEDDGEQELQRNRRDWLNDQKQKNDAAALDIDNAFQGEDSPFTGYQAERVPTYEEKRSWVIDDYLSNHSHNGELPPTATVNSFGYTRHMQQISLDQFGTMTADPEEMYQLIKGKAQERKDVQELRQDIAEKASTSAILSSAGEAGMSFGQWREEMKDHPGYKAESDFELYREFNAVLREEKSKVEPYREELAQVFDALEAGGAGTASETIKAGLKTGNLILGTIAMVGEAGKKDAGATAFSLYAGMTREEQSGFMDALGTVARMLPKEEKAKFLRNLSKSGGMVVDSLARNAKEGLQMSAMDVYEEDVRSQKGFDNWGGDSAEVNASVKREVEAGAKAKKEFLAAKGFAADVRNLEQSVYAPLKSYRNDGSAPGFWEGTAYAVPGIFASSVMAAVPFVGLPMMAFSMKGQAYEDVRANLIAGGMSIDDAEEFGDKVSGSLGLAMGGLEKLGSSAIFGKVPGFERFLTNLGDKVTNRMARGLIRTGLGGVSETAIEMTQQELPFVAQSIGSFLDEGVPDVQWTGEGGVLDGFWTQSASTFFSMLPLVGGSAMGGVNREAQIVAFAKAPREIRTAAGFSAEANDRIDAAATKGPSSAVAQFEAEMPGRDPNSEEAKAQVEANEEQAKRQAEAEEDMRKMGLFPYFLSGKQIEGIEVYDPTTDELIGTAKNGFEATSMAYTHLEWEESADQNRFDFIASLADASLIRSEKSTDENASFRINPGYEMTVQRMKEHLDQSLLELEGKDGEEADSARAKINAKMNRIDVQIARNVALEKFDGGDGGISRLIYGEMETETQGEQRSLIRRMWAGATVQTLVHEDGHAILKQLREKNLVSLPELGKFFLDLDAAGLAGKRHYRGKGNRAEKDEYDAGIDARFIPEGVTNPTWEQIDEAWAELSEVMILNTRGGQKSRMRELLHTNLSSMAKMQPGGAATKFKAFLRAMRDMFGLSILRKSVIEKSIKDGKFDESRFEEMRALMQGTTEQEEFTREVEAEYQETWDEAALVDNSEIDDDNPFSIGRRASSLVEARQSAAEFKGKEITNRDDSSVVTVSRNALDKMLSDSAARKSDSIPLHLASVANLDALFERAIRTHSGKDRNNDVNIAAVHRYYSPFNTGSGIAMAKMTIKEFAREGKRVYSVESVEMVKPAGNWVASISEDRRNYTPQAGFEKKLEQRIEEVNTSGASSFSIGHSRATDRLISDVASRVKRPETRVKIMGDIARRLEAGRRDLKRMVRAFGKDVVQSEIVDPRQMKSLHKERNVREAVRRDELENEAYANHQGILEDDTLTKLKQQPLHEYLSDPDSPLKGKLMARGVAIGKGENFFNPNKQGDYDGAAGVSRTLFGGMMAPDQAAQELFEQGLIKEPTPDAVWNALAKEAESVSRMKEYLAAAKADMKDAKATAKREAAEWMETAIKEQNRDHSPQAKIRRALVTLDAILMALPVELRGKVGGYTALANLKSDEKRLEYLQGRIEKLDQVVEKYLQKEIRKQIDKLFKRAEVKKNAKGVPGARLNADYTDKIEGIRELSALSKEDVAAEMERISDAMDIEQDTDKHDALGRELAELLTFGNVDNMKAQSLEEFFRNLNSVFQVGKTLKDIADAKQKAEVDAMKEITNHDVTGGGGRLTSSQAKARQKQRDKLKGFIGGLSKFHRQNVSFEWLLNGLARENKTVGTLKSKTHELFARMVHVATHSEKRANMAMQENYRDTLSGIFGGLKGMKLTKRITELMQEVEGSGVMRIDYLGAGKSTTKQAQASNILSMIEGVTDFKDLGMTQAEYDSAVAAYNEIKAKSKDGEVDGRRNVSYQSPNVGQPENLTLSQSQAINLLMLYRQESLKESMGYEGYSEETMKQMEDFLTPESKQIRDWLTQEYADNYHAINEVFREQNGVSLPQTEFYSPARRLADGTVKDLQIDGSGGQAMSTNPNFLISRTKNFAQVDQRADALSIYMAHMHQTNHYVNWAKPIRSMRSVFSDKNVKANIEAYAGKDLLSLIGERMNWMADGGNRAAGHLKWLDHARLGYTYSALAYNWGVAIKQLTSVPAYANDMGIKDFGRYAVKFMANPVKNFREMAGTDYVRTRFKEGYERDVIAGLKNEGGIIQKGLQTGMRFGKAGDIVPVMIGGWMARQQSFDRAKAAGMSDADAMARATIDFEMITDRSQQAGDMKDLSSFQGGGSFFKLFTMFKTSPRQYYANLYESALDFKAGKTGAGKEFARRFIIGHVILPLTFQFASDAIRSPFNDDEDEDYSPEDYVSAVLLGPLNGLFIAGNAIESIADGVAGSRVWFSSVTVLEPFVRIGHSIDDFEDGDFLETADEIARAIGKVTQSPLTFYDIIRKEIDRFTDD